MALFLRALGGLLLSLLGNAVYRILVALGIGVVTYTGMQPLLSGLKNSALQSFHDLPPAVFGMLAYMKVGIAFSIVTSAIVARMTLQGLTSDTVKRWVKK